MSAPLSPLPPTLATLKSLAGPESCRAYEHARSRNSRMPPPPTPCAECLAEFGRRLNWRTGSAAALEAARSLSAQWLTEQHVSTDIAAKWALFYINEKQRNDRNPSAAGRARFLITAIALLQPSRAAQASELQPS